MDERATLDPRLAALCGAFPNARTLTIESPRAPVYNCIAWAMNDMTRVWWPIGFGDPYWPPGVMRVLERRAFEYAFASQGYTRCVDGTLIDGIEKVCLYEKGGKPTHAARQLSTGRWVSKIGILEDIEHALDDLVGRRYGRPAAFFSRPRRM